MLKVHSIDTLLPVDEVGEPVEDAKIIPGMHVSLVLNRLWHGIVVSVVDTDASVLWSVQGDDPQSLYGKFALPLIRRVFPAKIAPDIVSVQPMSLPSGAIFYMDYTYGSNIKQTKKKNGKQENSASRSKGKRSKKG